MHSTRYIATMGAYAHNLPNFTASQLWIQITSPIALEVGSLLYIARLQNVVFGKRTIYISLVNK